MQIAKALYSLPRHFVGRTLRARADRQTVRFYDGLTLVKTHARQPPGGRSTDPTDFPAERSVYALRDVDALRRQAASTARPSAVSLPRCSKVRCPGRACGASTRCSACASLRRGARE